MEQIELQRAIEAILFASGERVEISQLVGVLEADEKAVVAATDALADELAFNRRGIRIIRLEKGYQMVSSSEMADYSLTAEELHALTENLCAHFTEISLLMDCYTVLAAKMSKHKNPINDVGVTLVHGIDDPESLTHGEFVFVKEHEMTPQKYVDELTGAEKLIFSKLYAGSFSKKLYRLFEYKKG